MSKLLHISKKVYSAKILNFKQPWIYCQFSTNTTPNIPEFTPRQIYESNEFKTPPNEPKKSGKSKLLFNTTLTFIVVFTGVVMGAKINNSFRNILVDNVPYSEMVLDNVDSVMDIVNDYLGVKKNDLKKETPSLMDELPSGLSPDNTQKSGNNSVNVADVGEELKRQKAAQEKELETLKLTINKNMAVTKKENDVAVRSLVDLETKIRQHAAKVTSALQSGYVKNKQNLWSEAYDALSSKALSKANCDGVISKAEASLRELKSEIDGALKLKDKPHLSNSEMLREAQRQYTNMQYDLAGAKNAVSRAESEWNLLAQYKDLIEHNRGEFQEELKNVLPKLGSNNEKQLQELLIEAHEKIKKLQINLEERSSAEQKRVQAALQQQKEHDLHFTSSEVEREREKLQNEELVMRQEWEREMEDVYQKRLKEALARQLGVHNDHLRNVLRVQRESMLLAQDKEIREAVLRERTSFEGFLAFWTNRVLGIEAAVEGRIEDQKEAQRAQDLWLAANAFSNQLDNFSYPGEFIVSGENIRRALRVLIDCAEYSQVPAIISVLQTLPNDIIDRGLYTQEALVKRFKKVKKVCENVAMLDESGASLPEYVLSWLQSLFVFKRTLDNPPTLDCPDLSSPYKRQLHIFSILSSAQKAIENSDLEMAVRLLAQLPHGASCCLASDWLNDARLFLEAQQAARVILAAAIASGAAGL